MYMCFSWVFKK